MTFLRKIDGLVATFLRTFVLVSLTAVFLLVLGGILFRIVPVLSMSWYDEILQFCFAWMIFLGAALLWRNRELFAIDLLQKAIAGPRGRLLGLAADLMSLAFVGVLAFKGWEYVALETETTPFLALQRSYWYAAVAAGATLMTIYSIAGLAANLRFRKAPDTTGRRNDGSVLPT